MQFCHASLSVLGNRSDREEFISIGFIDESEYPEKTGDIWRLNRWLESEQSQNVLNHKNNSQIWKIRACEVWLTKQGFYSAQSV